VRRVLGLLLVASLAALAYRNILGNEFVYDDGAQILRNYYIRDADHLRAIFTSNVWSFLGPHAISNYYRPVMHLVYMAGYALFGYEPAGYHAASIFFHVLNSLLALLVGEALLLPPAVALLSAVLFALHPINTEPVAWAAGIPELTYTCFFLLSLWIYIRVRPPVVTGIVARPGAQDWPGPPRPWPAPWLAVSVLAALAALFSKETGLMLPPAILLYEHLFRQSAEPHLRRVAFYAGHLGAAAFYLAMRIHSLGGFQVATNPYGVLPAGQFVLSAIYLVGKYLAKLFVPAPFNIFHMFHPARSVTDWRVLGGVVTLAAAAAAGGLLWRRRRPLAFAMVLLLLPLIPVLDTRAIGHNIFTERYLYLPAAAFGWLLAATLVHLGRSRQGLAAALAGLLALNYAALTAFRNRDWHDNVLLYTVTLQVSPESNLIRDNLGKTFLDGYGRPDLALAEFRECVRRAPEWAEYHYDLAQACAELRRYDEALAALRRSQELWPDYPEAYLARGDVYADMGDAEAACGQYRRALEVKPHYAEAWSALGALYRRQGSAAEAELCLRRALQVTDLADAHLNLGLLLLEQRRYREAEQAFRNVLVSEAHSVTAWHGLGRALLAQGRVAEATRCYRTALNERAYARPRRLGRVPVPDAVAIRQDLDSAMNRSGSVNAQRGVRPAE